jgi:hypothetical protein
MTQLFRVRLIERLRHLLRVEAASAQTTVTQRIPQVTAEEVQRVYTKIFRPMNMLPSWQFSANTEQRSGTARLLAFNLPL